MILTLVLGFLCAGIFSGEFQLKANAVFYSSYYGRNKAVWAKVKAGAIIITAIYWAVMLLYTMLVLGILGVDGANCPIQSSMSGWKSIYNITNAQEYILIVLGGYLGWFNPLWLSASFYAISNYVGFCEDKLISNSGNRAFYFDFSSIIFIRNKSTIIK